MTIEELIKSDTLPVYKKTVLNIIYTQNIIADKFTEILKPYDLSGEQFNVLRILRGQKGCPANMCSIQERMVAKTSNTTRLVDKLLLKGLVTRKVCDQNRRKIEVMITQKGLDTLNEVNPKVEQFEQSFSQNITPGEITLLNTLLEKLRNK